MGKKSAPSPPNPYAVAGAQTGTNIGTSIANAFLGNVNQITPTGSVTWDQTDTFTWSDPETGKSYKIPRFTATTEMTPEMQALHDKNMQNQQGLADVAGQQIDTISNHLSQPFSLDEVDINAPKLKGSIDSAGPITRTYGDNDFSADRQRVEEAIMGRMDPYIQQDRDRLRTQLVNQGFREGSEGYDRAFGNLERQIGDTRLGAILAAGQEQSRLMDMEAQRAAFQNAAQSQQFGQNMAMADYGNQISQQDFSNQMSLQNWQDSRAVQNRNQPINEITALMSGSQVSPPSFAIGAQPTIPTTDIAGILQDNYANQFAGWQANNQNKQQMLAAILGFGGNLLKAGF